MTQEAAVPPGLMAQIRQIAREEAAATYRSAPLRNATISSGGLTIRGGQLRVLYPDANGGEVGVYVGNIMSAVDSSYQGTGLLIQDANGDDIATFRSDQVTGNPLAILWDAAQNPVVYPDHTAGQGLARPYLGGGFHRSRYQDWNVSSTSATFETLWDRWIPKQHAGLQVAYGASMDTAATTGEVRVMVNEVQLGATTAESFVISNRYIGPAAVAGAHMSWLHVEIQARRTSASGALRVEPMYVMGQPLA